MALSRGSLTQEVVAGEEAAVDIPPQLRIPKPLHRILPVAAVVRIRAAARLILLARSLVEAPIPEVLPISLARSRAAARIPAAVVLILLVRIRAVVRVLVAVRLILLARIRAVVRTPAAVRLILLARIRAVVRSQAQRHTLPPARISLLLVTAPVMVRPMRLSRNARRMRRHVLSQALSVMPMAPQIAVSTRTRRMAISMPTSEVGLLQIV